MKTTGKNNNEEVKYYQPSFGDMNPDFNAEDAEHSFFDSMGNKEFEYDNEEEVIDDEIELFF